MELNKKLKMKDIINTYSQFSLFVRNVLSTGVDKYNPIVANKYHIWLSPNKNMGIELLKSLVKK